MAKIHEEQVNQLENAGGEIEELEAHIKVLMFIKIKEKNEGKWAKNLKKRLDKESEKFMNEHNVVEKDKFKQLLRNLTELAESPEV